MATGYRRRQQPASRAPLLLFLLLLLAGAAFFVGWRYFPEHLPESVTRQLPPSPTANPPLYKWRDDQGRWQITDTPPTDRAYEAVRVDPDTNVLPAGVDPEG